MGIRDKLQTKLAKAFDTKLSDAVNQFTGSYVIQSGWDPVTETGGETTVTYTGRGVFSDYTIGFGTLSDSGLGRIEGVNILAGDVNLTALTNEVTDKPAVNHVITGPDLVTGAMQNYTVINVTSDPAGATYSIQLRRA